MAQKISVIIPTFDGKDLLANNLPNVIENCPNCEIIVVDDASSDDSVSFINNNFPSVKILKHAKNKGFAQSVNDGASIARGDLIILLNSDVSPRANFLVNALSHFKKNKRIFAVGFADYSHEAGKVIVRGRGGASFEKGFISHFALPPKIGETLWVSGGSGMFDRKKFLELGGFDIVFAPFYWEDIDLSFRAWQLGYTCLFEPHSRVDHFHKEGAIKKKYSQFFIKTVSYKNQFLFVWKNIADCILILKHFLWLPYHFAIALTRLDLAFFGGFTWALLAIPRLIFDSPWSSNNYKLSDKEVLKKFER